MGEDLVVTVLYCCIVKRMCKCRCEMSYFAPTTVRRKAQYCTTIPCVVIFVWKRTWSKRSCAFSSGLAFLIVCVYYRLDCFFLFSLLFCIGFFSHWIGYFWFRFLGDCFSLRLYYSLYPGSAPFFCFLLFFPFFLFPSCPADHGPDRQPHFVFLGGLL